MKEFKKSFEESSIPRLVKEPITRVQLAQYAGASGDFNPIHIDEEFAQKSPLKGVIAHGMLSMGFLSEYAEKMAGDTGEVKMIKVQFRSMVRPGDVISCEAKPKEENQNINSFEIIAKNQKGETVIKGVTEIKRNGQ